MTSQHGGGHSFYGSNRKKRCSKWRTFNFENDHGFWALSVTFESQNLLFLAFYLKSKLFNSFKLPYKIRLLAFRSLLRSAYVRVSAVLDHGRTLISLRKQCKVNFMQRLSSKTSIPGQNRLEFWFHEKTWWQGYWFDLKTSKIFISRSALAQKPRFQVKIG